MLTQRQLTLRTAGMSHWVEHASIPFSSAYDMRRVDCALEDPLFTSLSRANSVARARRLGGRAHLLSTYLEGRSPLAKSPPRSWTPCLLEADRQLAAPPSEPCGRRISASLAVGGIRL